MKKLLFTSLSGLALAGSLSAQTTEITVTGATAFREAAVRGILAAYQDGGSVTYAYAGSNFASGSQHYFTGTFPGIAGTTIVRTSWSGSVEGVRDVKQELNVKTLQNPPTSAGNGTTGGTNVSAGTFDMVPNIAFSDVIPDQTPYKGGGLVSQDVGVIAFVMMANNGAPAGLTNITNQQYKALASNGFMKLSMFTGLDSDDDKLLLNTGRNDGSGTRTVLLAETGYGYTNLIKHYKEQSLSGSAITELRLWPLGDGPTPVDNRSTVWNADTAGNGGYSSGGTLRGVLTHTTSTSTVITNEDGIPDFEGVQSYLVGFLGLSDATAVRTTAKTLAYNGVTITPVTIGTADDTALPGDPPTTSGNLKVGDKRKISNGQYSAWSFEQIMYDNTDKTTAELTFFNAVKAKIQLEPSIGTAGLTLPEMGVTRSAAGGVISPTE